jgi:hypothetical protein
LKERCHERRQRTYACGIGDQQTRIIAAIFPDLLFERDHSRDRWLDFSVRLGRRQAGKLVDGLVQISDVLGELCYRATDHDPESNVHFDRDPHRASPRSFR